MNDAHIKTLQDLPSCGLPFQLPTLGRSLAKAAGSGPLHHRDEGVQEDPAVFTWACSRSTCQWDPKGWRLGPLGFGINSKLTMLNRTISSYDSFSMLGAMPRLFYLNRKSWNGGAFHAQHGISWECHAALGLCEFLQFPLDFCNRKYITYIYYMHVYLHMHAYSLIIHVRSTSMILLDPYIPQTHHRPLAVGQSRGAS